MKKKIITLLILSCTAAMTSFCGQAGGGDEGRDGPGVGQSIFTAIDCTDSMECQDGIWCNGIEYCGCFGGVCGRCLPGFEQNCEDNNPCTVDNCINDTIGIAGSTGVPGEFGTGHCQHAVICQYCMIPEDCDDGDICTTHTCVANICRNVTNPCDDSNFCTLDSCDPVAGCANDPIPGCCNGNADCEDGNPCTVDTCNTLTHACVYTGNTGAACDFPDPCFDPGICRSDGLCGPGALSAPANDTCDGVIGIPLDGAGEGSVTGSTLCASDDYTSSCGGGGNADVVYRVSYQVGTAYELYSYDVALDANFNSVLYAQSGCGNPSTELTCNDNCASNALITCSDYSLALLDSAINIQPAAVGTMKNVYLGVDGIGGSRGDFQLRIVRTAHRNNPCHSQADTGRRVDATFGGEFRGNIDGYINDMEDSSHTWLKSPCHSAALSAGSDWPGHAWFVLNPAFTTTYCIWTDEVAPAGWVDTVIGVWDNTLPSGSGCGGVKRYLTCAHLDGRNGAMNPTRTEITIPGGSTYMVGISSFARPTSGDYLVRFDIGECGQSCEDQGGVVFNDHCYIRFITQRLFPEAETACYSWGGHLATIADAAENNFLKTTFAAPSPDSPWIGFTDRNVEGAWEWVTGEPVTYTNWQSGQPDNAGGNQDWGYMRKEGDWGDGGPVSSPRSCMCEKP